MTTNVFCKKTNTLASDSRWSVKVTDKVAGTEVGSTYAIVYVDDTGYDKICYDEDTGYIFAGTGPVIEKWKIWALSPNQALLTRPEVALGFSVCMTDLESSDIFYEHGQQVRDAECRMAGTGAKPAYDCWAQHGNAKKAVESAVGKDFFSGGQVKFLSGTDKSHNLSFSTDFSLTSSQLLKKGMVMYPVTSQISVPLNQAAISDPRIASLVDQIQKNQISAEAPSGFDPVVWTPSDEARLDEALAKRAQRRLAKKAITV